VNPLLQRIVYHFLSRGCFQAGLTFYRNFTLLLLFFFTYTAILCHQQLQNREIARPDESRHRCLALRRFFSSFAPIYRSQFHGIDISPGQIRAPSLLSLARSLAAMHARVYLPAGFTVLIFTFAPHPAAAPRTTS